jgi:hypothetical protein
MGWNQNRMKATMSWGVACAALIGLMGLTMRQPQEKATPQPELPKVRGQCEVCHRQEAQDWAQSRHAQAWVSETFAMSTNNRAVKMCLPCHAPEPILVKGFGEHPDLRSEQREHGIDCISCHRDANGAYHGTLGTQPEDHPGPVVKDEKFGTHEMCGTCHEVFGTYDAFKQTQWAKDPRGCVTCHMPVVERPIAVSPANLPARKARVHRFEGATPEMFQKGVRVEAERKGDALQVKLESVGVGHTVPTGPEYVVVIVDVRLLKAGSEVGKKQELLADNVAIDGSDTRLQPGERRVVRIPLIGEPDEALVRILHKHHRELPDDKVRVFYETRVKL